MSLIDLLRMSSGNLKRRKLRTFLTVLGVVIGTASIVVMISLGLGMQQSMYQQIDESGGLTTIEVNGAGGYGGMYGGDQEAPEEYITDEVIEQFKLLEHIEYVTPVLEVSAIALKGNYEGYLNLQGLTHEALEAYGIPLKGGGGYWETGELPDIDFSKDSLFLILDTDSYYMNQGNSGFGDMGGEGSSQPKTIAKKHVVKACGVVEGGIEEYNTHSYSTYCDIETLKTMLKKEFRGRAIPGQPTMENGKPYKYFIYNNARVKVDDLDSVETVSEQIRAMGFQTYSNAEFLETMQEQYFMIQAVLGGIGAVSLLVAAIGIANTMMMSIYERTKEIGVIKVLGCSLKNIKQMFLMEAGFIGLLGGLVGNVLSFMVSFVINKIAGSVAGAMGIASDISYIPPWLVLISLVFAIFVGMAAGYFPALRAMRLSPLAAIRNE